MRAATPSPDPRRTRLSRALDERPPRRVTPVDLFRLARRHWLAGERIDVGALAAELGIGRATAFRWVGSRDLLLGEIVWSLCEPLMLKAAANSRARGAHRIAAVSEATVRGILDSVPLREFIRQDPEYALRLLTSKNGPVQARAIERVHQLMTQEVEGGHFDPPLALATLAYLVVRLSESFIYAEVITGQAVDMADAGLAIELLLSGRVAKRRNASRPVPAAAEKRAHRRSASGKPQSPIPSPPRRRGPSDFALGG